MKIKSVFIDRDGTIGGGEEVKLPKDFTLYPKVQDSLNLLKNAGKQIFAFTNQPVIAMGEVSMDDYEQELKKFGFHQSYICPHLPEHNCECRKPATGLLIKAAKENDLHLTESIVIGDRWTDMLAAHQAGCYKILVKTGAGTEANRHYQNKHYFGTWAEVRPDYVAEDLFEAVCWMLKNN
ncbi:HAD-IIIA family hydrolase [Gracilibacillus sp. D59]|uniref:HAD-IIIA family hydrolase n=1 Tax=Gracilibacillus sp. D59 TaxID=3457434 RepID=UPI003FCC7877